MLSSSFRKAGILHPHCCTHRAHNVWYETWDNRLPHHAPVSAAPASDRRRGRAEDVLLLPSGEQGLHLLHPLSTVWVHAFQAGTMPPDSAVAVENPSQFHKI
jgi:hypothetical protein